MVTDQAPHWDEDDSRDFLRYADIMFPVRQEQTALVASLVPAQLDEEFIAVDIGCGSGLLSRALLERYPRCRVVALDGSPAMLERAAADLAAFRERVTFDRFDLFEPEWLARVPSDVRCFASSLVVHHLDGAGKRALFRDLAARLSPGGALLLQDLVEPPNQRVAAIYATMWDARVHARSVELTGTLDAYHFFQDGWNHFATPDVAFDKPSGLHEQLRWLEEAGLHQVDCFHLWYGHAVYGGYKP